MMPAVTPAETMQRRGLKPITALAADKPHGNRLRYMAGCRCDLCRKANSSYEAERIKARAAGDWNGIVPARAARRHMLALSKAGIGRRSVQAATDISDTILAEIRSGKRKQIRARTEKLILAVTAESRGDKSLVPAAPTWKLIEALLRAGFTKGFIALQIGRKTPALQLNRDWITVKNEAAVARLHRRLMTADEALVDAKTARRLINALRSEWIAVSRIVAELDEPLLVEDGEIRLPPSIPAGLEAKIVALHQRLMN